MSIDLVASIEGQHQFAGNTLLKQRKLPEFPIQVSKTFISHFHSATLVLGLYPSFTPTKSEVESK